MIQDFTHVQYFAILFKGLFSMSSPPLASHTLQGFARCIVLFLLKNPAYKQDKWFKNNSHNLTEINEGRGWTDRGRAGKEVGGGTGSGDMHPFIPSCQWKGWWQEQQQQSWLAFDLCKAPGVWVCHLKCFSSYTRIPKEEEKEKETPCHDEEGWLMWKKTANQSAVWQALSSSPACPHSSQKQDIRTDSLDSSNVDGIWSYGRKYSDGV